MSINVIKERDVESDSCVFESWLCQLFHVQLYARLLIYKMKIIINISQGIYEHEGNKIRTECSPWGSKYIQNCKYRFNLWYLLLELLELFWTYILESPCHVLRWSEIYLAACLILFSYSTVLNSYLLLLKLEVLIMLVYR